MDVDEIGLVCEITGGTLYTFVIENMLKTVLDRWLVLVHLKHPCSLFLLISPCCKDSVSFNAIVCVVGLHRQHTSVNACNRPTWLLCT